MNKWYNWKILNKYKGIEINKRKLNIKIFQFGVKNRVRLEMRECLMWHVLYNRVENSVIGGVGLRFNYIH